MKSREVATRLASKECRPRLEPGLAPGEELECDGMARPSRLLEETLPFCVSAFAFQSEAEAAAAQAKADEAAAADAAQALKPVPGSRVSSCERALFSRCSGCWALM